MGKRKARGAIAGGVTRPVKAKQRRTTSDSHTHSDSVSSDTDLVTGSERRGEVDSSESEPTPTGSSAYMTRSWTKNKTDSYTSHGGSGGADRLSRPTILSKSKTAGSKLNAEQKRLQECSEGKADWYCWGPYLAERQWGTVREDNSQDGNCWEHFSHDQATHRAYQWGEDGLLGVCDQQAQLCLAPALWNGKDPILKERLFGLTGPQGNHGEDVKECYYYLDSTPTHSYMRALYKYPQLEFPYSQLLEENQRRGVKEEEYELLDTGVFNEGLYWDVTAEYAKYKPRGLVCRYTIANRGPKTASLYVLPTLWFRNTWSWTTSDDRTRPQIELTEPDTVVCSHTRLGKYVFQVDTASEHKPERFIFTENDTNMSVMMMEDGGTLQQTKSQGQGSAFKDAFHNYIIKGEDSVKKNNCGTKCAVVYKVTVAAGSDTVLHCTLSHNKPLRTSNRHNMTKLCQDVVNKRHKEAQDFYKQVIPASLSEHEQSVCRQAYAGLCFSKQFYFYGVKAWLSVSGQRCVNQEWKHMLNKDVILMPDKWEFPWYATWDLAFHAVAMADIDRHFAQQQLLLLLSDRYMHPSGQLPAYEFNFSDTNPPVHAWACLKVYRHPSAAPRDISFLKKAFHRLLLNFTWWLNKKSIEGRYIFGGGFLGLDNISCVERSNPPQGTTIEQVDGTSWMAFYSLCLMEMALELAQEDHVYEDMAIRFLDQFCMIGDALNGGGGDRGLYDTTDGFYYDQLCVQKDAKSHTLRVKSVVGLTPLLASCSLQPHLLKSLPDFQRRLQVLAESHSNLVFVQVERGDGDTRYMLSATDTTQRNSLLSYLLDTNYFLSSFGIRALAKTQTNSLPAEIVEMGGEAVTYCPGESNSCVFGGNSNWRGPVWLCMNVLLLEALQRFGSHLGDSVKVAYPTGSDSPPATLCQVATDIARRLTRIFLPDNAGHRPCHGGRKLYAEDNHWRHLVLFYEYFHGDSGHGCGASHQTGWTALVAGLLRQLSDTG